MLQDGGVPRRGPHFLIEEGEGRGGEEGLYEQGKGERGSGCKINKSNN
jgi:hypothetical protein